VTEKEIIQCDKPTTEWLAKNRRQITTLCKCEDCGLYYRWALGHECEEKEDDLQRKTET
jgi:hypothetical protein